MLWLQKGDCLPAVALVQQALGFDAKWVDGIFGNETKRRVVEFQKKCPGLLRDGIVGPNTWARLRSSYNCSVINVVDTADRDLAWVVAWLKYYGGNPIKPAFRSNALDQIGRTARARIRTEGPIGLLRFYGHGNSGIQNLSLGKGGHWLKDDPSCVNGVKMNVNSKTGPPDACRYAMTRGEGMSFENMERIKSSLAPLRGCFSPLGSIELHGCQVANAVKGQKFLFALAVSLGVPVTAALGTSKIANEKQILRFESATSSWFPLAGDLVPWARKGARKAQSARRTQRTAGSARR